MGQIIADVSPSVDGYVAGKGISIDKPFGDAGHRLHHWLGFEGAKPTPADQEAAERMFAGAGAVVLGRRMFDVGISTWGDDGAFGLPSFVVTHRSRGDLVKGPTTFSFITEGTAKAVRLAKEAAGDKNVVVVGGADIVQQCLAAGLVDALHLHIAPTVLGAGTALFASETPRYELETTSAATTPHATHLTFSINRPQRPLPEPPLFEPPRTQMIERSRARLRGHSPTPRRGLDPERDHPPPRPEPADRAPVP